MPTDADADADVQDGRLGLRLGSVRDCSMSHSSARWAFASGVVLANALPHAFAAAVGATQMTPLRGRTSGPGVNAVWSGINLAAAYALSRRISPSSAQDRAWFKAGIVTFSTWVLLSEWVTDLN